jgi:cytoplasmic iron level regulating protein YaaA (DUF328/UPF0246 family)
MKIVISPAKSMNFDVDTSALEYSTIPFQKETEGLAKKMAKFSGKKLEKMMGISAQLGELNQSRYQNFHLTETPTENVKQAGAIFTGEVYRGLDFLSLDKKGVKLAQDKLRILSGLYGILKPLDLIHAYRLEMGTRWAVTPKTKNLYAFWGTKIADSLNTEMETGEVLINLASNEYFKAVDQKVFHGKVITPHFKENKNGVYKIVMMFAKNARGKMARFIIEKNITQEEEIKTYEVDGYVFNAEQSSETDWVFTRG